MRRLAEKSSNEQIECVLELHKSAGGAHAPVDLGEQFASVLTSEPKLPQAWRRRYRAQQPSEGCSQGASGAATPRHPMLASHHMSSQLESIWSPWSNHS